MPYRRFVPSDDGTRAMVRDGDCDAYPFASSQQGVASTAGGVRVPQGCGWTQVAGRGPNGFSRCLVRGPHNRADGSALNDMPRRYRVLVGAKYTVKVIA